MHCSKLITVREAAEDLGCSPESVRRYIHQGILAADKVGSQWLIDTFDLECFEDKEGEIEDEEEVDEESYDDDPLCHGSCRLFGLS